MAITIAELWREGRQLAERHAVTVAPVAAAFMFLPQVVREALVAPPATQADIGIVDIAISFAVVAFAFVGQAAIAAIMLGGREAPYDVADALRRSLRLLPRLLLVVLMLGLAALPLILLLGVVAIMVIGADRVGDPQAAAQTFVLLFLPVIAAFAYVGARLFVLFPVLLVAPGSAREAIRRSWRMTSEQPWTLVGFMVSALFGITFLTLLVTIVAGGLLGLLLGTGSVLGKLLTVTLATLVGTAVGVIVIGASVAAYRRLAPPAR